MKSKKSNLSPKPLRQNNLWTQFWRLANDAHNRNADMNRRTNATILDTLIHILELHRED